MTNRSEILKLCPQSDQWPEGATHWIQWVDDSEGFWSGSIPGKYNIRHMVSLDELEAWEAEQEEEAVEKAFHDAFQAREKLSPVEAWCDKVRHGDAPQPAPPHKWTDEAIDKMSLRYNPSGIVHLTKQVRDDTAAERDAYWQKRIAELEIELDRKTEFDAMREDRDKLKQRIAELEARLNGAQQLLETTEKAATEARDHANQFSTDLETAEGVIKRLKQEREAAKQRIAELKANLYEANPFWDLFEGEYADAKKAAQLWELWQAFVTARNNTTICTLEMMPPQRAGIYDNCGEASLIADSWPETTAWLKKQTEDKPFPRQNLNDEIDAVLHEFTNTTDRDWRVSIANAEHLLRHIKQGIKPTE